MKYRYSLEKGSKKFTCPECEDKRSFKRYIDIDTEKYLGTDIGRCDHEIKCGYHRSPKDAGILNNHTREDLSRRIDSKRISLIPDVFTIKGFSYTLDMIFISKERFPFGEYTLLICSLICLGPPIIIL